jgi:hypothetical protein
MSIDIPIFAFSRTGAAEKKSPPAPFGKGGWGDFGSDFIKKR